MGAADNIYGAAKSGDGGEMKKVPDSRKRMVRLLAALIVIAALAAVLLTNVLVIAHPNEYVAVQQFGRIMSVTHGPGLGYKIPFVQNVVSIPRDARLYDLPIADVITKDKKNMVADSFVLWRVSDPVLFIQSVGGSVAKAEDYIGNIVYNAMKTVISNLSQTEIITGRDQLANVIFDNIGDSLSKYGVTLIAIETKHLDLPDDNKQAVYERMISERNNIAASYMAEGEAEATKIRTETDKAISIQLSAADAQAEQIIAAGEAEYMRILAEAFNSEERAEFYSFVRSLDAAKASLSGGDKTVILTKDSPLAQLFYGGLN